MSCLRTRTLWPITRWTGLLACFGLLLRPAAAQAPGDLLGAFRDAPPPAAVAIAAGGIDEEAYDLLDIDSLFYVENQGLDRLIVTINDGTFTLTSDSTALGRGANMYYFPPFGEVTVHIGAYLEPGDENYYRLRPRGPQGSMANIVIADLMLTPEIHYTLHNLTPLPQELALLQSYPNPFRSETRLVFTIPESRVDGLDVTLDVYDLLGRWITSLVSGTHFPGRLEARWDGRDAAGRDVAAGVYLYRLVTSDGTLRTGRLVRVR